jgi:hypothetical protein
MDFSSRIAYWLALLSGVLCAGGIAFLVIGDPFDDEQTDTPPGASSEGWTVVVPDSTAGFALLDLAFLEAGDEARRNGLTAAGLANAATGQYHEQGTAPEPWLTFVGGDLVPALDEGAVAQTAEARLGQVFGLLGLPFDGTMRPFESGPMGGEARCTTLTTPSRQPVACGWVDRWTVGAVMDLRPGATEEAVAELLRSMRPDFEVARL